MNADRQEQQIEANDLFASPPDALPFALAASPHQDETNPSTLASLPLGARLILRCRADWRVAAVCAVAPDRITISVGAPSGRTYRVRRSGATVLSYDGPIPILCDKKHRGGAWRVDFARYDARW